MAHKKTKAKGILAAVSAAVADWPAHARQAGVSKRDAARIARAQRRDLFR